MKQRVEALTDDLAAAPYDALEPDELDELVGALEPLAALLRAAPRRSAPRNARGVPDRRLRSLGASIRSDTRRRTGPPLPQLLRVQNFTVSADGFGAGEGQSLERPFGHADPADFFAWAGATASWPNRTDPGGSRGLDDYLTRDFAHNIGAEIMGRNKFGPQRGPWPDEDWKGWWGDEPPFHTPVFVLTHHARPSYALGDTTFHFVSGEPADVLATARAAAEGRDVRLGGGASTVRQFLDADLVDTLHVAVCPVELGAGSRLWDSPSELDDRFHREEVPSPSGGVVHHLLWRR